MLLQVAFRSAITIWKPRKQRTLLQALEWWRSCFEPLRVAHLGQSHFHRVSDGDFKQTMATSSVVGFISRYG
jgi:hypothetical protein